MKQERTVNEVLYTLDEAIFFCEQLKLELSYDEDNIKSRLLNDCFYACLNLCRVLNKIRLAITREQ